MQLGLPASRVVMKWLCWRAAVLCSEYAAHGRHGRLAWSPAGFLNVCRQLLHRSHEHALWVLGLAENVLHTTIMKAKSCHGSTGSSGVMHVCSWPSRPL